jgi:hypothetical protein
VQRESSSGLKLRRFLVFTLLALVLANSASFIPALVGVASSQSTSMIAAVAVGGISDTMAQMAKTAKIGYLRSDITFDARFQTLYTLAQKYGLSIIGILDYQTLNSRKSFTLNNWRETVTKAQKTYPLISVWEIWNEPTLAKYQVGYMDGKPQHYFDMLKVAYEVLKAKNPEYKILGLGGAQLGVSQDYPFAESVFTLGGGSYMDGLSIHAYPYSLNSGQTWSYYSQLWATELAKYKQFNKPIWVTETGVQSGQMTESSQSEYLSNSWAFFLSQGVRGYVWYELRDYQDSTGATVSFGLLHADNSIKLSYSTYSTLPR